MDAFGRISLCLLAANHQEPLDRVVRACSLDARVALAVPELSSRHTGLGQCDWLQALRHVLSNIQYLC